jgi:AraC-like DNA-binding protein
LQLPQLSASEQSKAGDLIQHLVRLSLQSESQGERQSERQSENQQTAQRLALFDRARFYVLQHLRDTHLNADRVASALNCSRRALYYAFEASGESVASYIQRERLQACVRNLQDERHPAAPITEIAVSWGFTNLSHFSRVFKDKTGTSPTQFRKART